MAENRYTLDTNVIMENPYILNEFKDSIVYIPNVVLEELDKHKNDPNLSRNIRIFSNILDKLHEDNYITENNNEVHFVDTDDDLKYLGGNTNDNAIIHIAMLTKSELISNDVLVRVKARNIAEIEATGVTQKIFDNNFDESYKGYLEIFLEDSIIDLLYAKKYLDIRYISDITIYPNMFFIIKRYSGNSGGVLAKVSKDAKCIEVIEEIKNVYGINPQNVQQLMAFHLLLDDEVNLVTLIGKAGSGKTLLSMSAGLELTQNENAFNNILCYKPIVDMGKELGALPGEKHEKLAPYVASYYDALEFIFGGKEEMKNALNGFQDELEIDALNYIRGRSLPYQYIIIDEAQNLSRHEIKTIITRAGKGSKVILMGDPSQIDAKHLNESNNGLSYVVDKFKEQGISGHITLKKGERSELSDIASDIL